MTSSNILTIGTETSDASGKVSATSNPKAYFEFEFERHLRKILLNGETPKPPDDGVIERFAATEIMRKGKQYYEFGPDNFKAGTMFSGPSFNPKQVVARLRQKIGKEHWVNDNVIQYKKNSMCQIQQLSSDVLHEENIEIYQYLCYLNEHSKRK
ncbi:hypothetical protein KR018_000788 [Drosophila ironensis]|nr:hypothetical protein KR018_000788 [Drosophila ironensis]